MNKISLIGDCHSSRVLTEHLYSKNNIDFVVWSKGGLKLSYGEIKGFDPFILYSKNSLSDPFEGDPFINALGLYERPFSTIKDDGVILIWIGYVDIKNILPTCNNSDKIIEKSIINLKNFFKNGKLLFVEPFPQFYNFHSPKNEKHIEHSFKERQQQNEIFIKNLKFLLKKHNLPQPISQKNIIECTGIKTFDETVMEPSGIDENGKLIYERDALLQKYYKNIYQLFIEKATEHFD